MRRLIRLLFVGLFIFGPLALSASARPGLHAETMKDCASCHLCDNPTAEDLCMRGCSRPTIVSASGEVPEVVILDKLSEIYVPVVFPHALHAEMGNMGGENCAICHHHNPPGRIMRCEECHAGSSNPADLGQPGLKGAYHRQCLNCHREWSHETDCAVCHAKRAAGEVVSVTVNHGDIMGMLHPNIEEPDTWVYQVDGMEEEGPVVTFHHKEHIHLFGLKCVECHRKENCSRCHDAARKTEHIRSDPHEDCIACHDVSDNCTTCHAREEKPGFDHLVRTGFALRSFHQQLDCASCHKGGRIFTGLSKDCSSCHRQEWMPETFDHKQVDLEFDELHIEASCADCHSEGLGKSVSCAACHDTDREYPRDLPGKRISSQSNP